MLLEAELYYRLKNFELNLGFAVQEGCLGILGASGCGKSITLKSIAGILRPDRGRIMFCSNHGENRVFFDAERKICIPSQQRRVGYLFQHYALFPNMTVEENIQVGLEGRRTVRGRIRHGQEETYRGRMGNGISREEEKRKLRKLVEQFRLEGLEKRYPGQLSGGQQQRTALARIFAYDPDVLLLDEPFSAMDAFLREGLRLELAKVLKHFSGISIMVTHDRDEAFQLCSHLLLMDRGRLLTMGETREIFRRPGSCQAARLTGCKNISRIQCLGKHRVRALDWNGLELTTEEAVEERHGAIGIRAHDLEGLSDGQAKAWMGNVRGNIIPVGNPSVSEMPFEWYITLENGLWWKKEKAMDTHNAAEVIPPWLRVDPTAILLLEGDG